MKNSNHDEWLKYDHLSTGVHVFRFRLNKNINTTTMTQYHIKTITIKKDYLIFIDGNPKMIVGFSF